jgi:hypothetical protein
VVAETGRAGWRWRLATGPPLVRTRRADDPYDYAVMLAWRCQPRVRY